VRADVLVPGDVLVLSAGNLIPADGRILEARDFLVSEASMTGESFPVEKQPGVVPADTPLAQRTNVVFLGASVRSGTARVLVTETGRRTAFGAIAARLRAREPETNFARGLRQFGYLLIRAMVVIVLSVLTVNLLLLAVGDLRGQVGGVESAVHRAGMSDSVVRLAVKMRGGPARSPLEFAKAGPIRSVLGPSIKVLMPTGQYGHTA
jgi:magnesium-transporting ATPase (P-type)